jgi:hypothetical protein
MVDQIPDMPPGTLGFRVSERLNREAYAQVLVPPLRQAAAAGVPGEMHLFHERDLRAAKTWLSA